MKGERIRVVNGEGGAGRTGSELSDAPWRSRGTGWAVFGFYLLVAFEFFYMASPFAVYFYSALRPGLEILSSLPGGAWLLSFFLPHYAETRSPVIDALAPIGGVLTTVGIVAFVVGAGQVYYAKLARKGAVTGGLYRRIRHPQYAALIVAGFGMLLLWPRNLVLVLYVTMVFVYQMLARHEEQVCVRRFGQEYVRYLARTRRFFPSPMSARGPQEAKRPSPLRTFVHYLLVLAAAIAVGRAIHGAVIGQLYSRYADRVLFVSLAKIPDAALDAAVAMATGDPAVRKRLATASIAANERLLAYLLPEGMYISEVPMDEPAVTTGHDRPPHDGRRYRIVFTKAALDPDASPIYGIDILRRPLMREPLFEVWLDMVEGAVLRIAGPSRQRRYPGIPVPAY